MNKITKRIISMAVSATLIAGYATVPLQNISSRPIFYINTAQAATLKNGLEYIIEDDNAIIVGCEKSVASIEIPDKIDGYDVTVISDNAFEYCENLQNVILPQTLNRIGSLSFYGCVNLKSIVIPDSVTEIGEYSFDSCNNLKSVTLSNNLKSIGYHAFYGAAITEITIPASLEWADSPFAECTSLESVTFAPKITKVASGLFRECNGLKSITIPEGITTIGSWAFYGCSNLTDITLPDTLEIIEEHAIQECDSLKSIVIPDSVTEIGESGVDNCDNLKSITLSNNLKSIGYHAFYGAAITEITIPASLEWADSPFANCTNLSYVEFSENSTKICDGIFYDCSSLKHVLLPISIKEIGELSFANCTQLTTIIGGDKNITFKPHSFENCPMLHDSRFSLLDSSSYISVNNNVGSVNGIVNYTLRYQLNENVAKYSSDHCILLNIPEGMSIIPDSIASNIIDEESTDYTSDTFYVTKPTGIIKFSCRIQEHGEYSISPAISFFYNGDYWEQQTIGSIDVDVPKLTCNALNTVNTYKAEVHGIAEKDASIEIYVDGKKVKTIKSNKYTGKYNTVIPLPEKTSGSTYLIYAQNGKNISDEITITYGADEPVVKSVKFIYNENEETDITKVFTEGASPVFTLSSTYYQFEIETENTNNIYKVFVTSTKGNDEKLLEAHWNTEKQRWITNDYFDYQNQNYLAGALNIRIINKKEIEIQDTNDNSSSDIFDKFKDNSSVEVIEDNPNDTLLHYTISDGINTNELMQYTEISDELNFNDKKVSAEEVAKSPSDYGFDNNAYIVEEDGIKYKYYLKVQTPTIQGAFSPNIAISPTATSTNRKYKDYNTGYVAVKTPVSTEISPAGKTQFYISLFDGIAEEVTLKTIENVTGWKNWADTMGYLASCYSLPISYIQNTSSYYDRVGKAWNSNELVAKSTMLYVLQMSNELFWDSVAVASGVTIVGPALCILAKAGVSALIQMVEEELDKEIEAYYNSNGHPRFIIDPSGYVYEAIPSNRIENAEMKIYYLDTESGDEILWNANDYDQFNPLYTDKYGKYAWDVPEGKWKVVCSKEGYETSESEWLNVPPIQTDVNFALISYESPLIETVEYRDNQFILSFSKYMKPETINNKTININGLENYTISPIFDNKGDKFAIKYAVKADFSQVNTITISSTDSCMSYSDSKATPTSISVTINTDISNILLGDVNKDGMVDASDASLVLVEYAILSTGGDKTLTGELEIVADVNSDGTVDASDASLILSFYAFLSTGGTITDMREWLVNSKQ